MKIVALPDLHGAFEQLDTLATELASTDVVLLVGDLTNAGNTYDAQNVIDTIQRLNKSVLAVPGNWDGLEVAHYLTSQQINLQGRHVIRSDIAFIGVGAALVSGLQSPNEIIEADFEKYLEEATYGLNPNTSKVVVSHQPPAHTLTARVWSGLDLGSHAVRAYIERHQPIICFTGHIHEAVGVDWINKTAIINPSPLWQNHYTFAEIQSGKLTSVEIRNIS